MTRSQLLTISAALFSLSACDEYADVGERPDAPVTNDAAMATSDTGTLDTGHVVPADAGVDAAGSVAEGLAHIEVTLVTNASHPTTGSTSFRIVLRGMDAAPVVPTETASPIETFGPCRVFMGSGAIPPAEPNTVDLGSDVFFEIGSSGRVRMDRDATGGAITYIARGAGGEALMRPMPPAGTVVHTYVILGGHTYESSATVNTIDLTSPTSTVVGSDLRITHTAGSDLLVQWDSNGENHVVFNNLRYFASGGGPGSLVSCESDAPVTSFTIPARIVSTYMRNAAGSSSDSSLTIMNYERVVPRDGAISLGVERSLRGLQLGWPHG